MRGAACEIAVWFGVLVATTVVLISSVSPVESLVGGVAALGGALAARRLRLAAGIAPGGAKGVARYAAAVTATTGSAPAAGTIVTSPTLPYGDSAVSTPSQSLANAAPEQRPARPAAPCSLSSRMTRQ
ncbi:hypothetical protein [Kitasatospora sp. NPDC008115]|uniref:hypothetical protein n=1 Tax=Kitasatospora sp. NPDC008115 TaxID=3364022 RepID=UPI0036E414E0